RRRQSRHPRGHPQQERPAQSRRVGHHEDPRHFRRQTPRAPRPARTHPPHGPAPPRIFRRLRLSRSPDRRNYPSRRAHHHHRRFLRHHHQRPQLQKRPHRRTSPLRTGALRRHPIRSPPHRSLRPRHASAPQPHHRSSLPTLPHVLVAHASACAPFFSSIPCRRMASAMQARPGTPTSRLAFLLLFLHTHPALFLTASAC